MPIASTDLTTARDLDAALWEVPRRRSAKELFRERREALIRAFDQGATADDAAAVLRLRPADVLNMIEP
jgi:hypothetical protein